MFSIGFIKNIAALAASIGATTIVENAISVLTPSNVSKVNKFFTAIGGIFISGMLADSVSEYAGKKVEEVIEQTTNIIAVSKEVTSDEDIQDKD